MVSRLSNLLFILGASLLLSVFVFRYNTRSDVPYCIDSPACRGTETKGTVTRRAYGYPLAYKESVTFSPKDSSQAGYGSASRETDINYPNVAVNTVFWFALLMMIFNTYGHLRRRKQPADALK